MDVKQLMEFIYELEQKHPVTTYAYNEVELWPVVRFFLLSYYIRTTFKMTPEPKKQIPTTSFVGRLRAKRAHNKIVREHGKLIEQQLSSTANVNCDALFFSQEEHHTEILGGKRYNRFTDPMWEYLSERGSACVKLGLELPRFLGREGYTFEPIMFNPADYETYCRSLRALGMGLNEVAIREECTRVIRECALEDKIDEMALAHQVVRILEYKDLMVKLLEKFSPKQVYVVCYYSLHCFATVLACKELDIICIDIQHGKNGANNTMTSHWSVFPELGYKLLPDVFWTWGEQSVEDMRRWYPEGSTLHTPINGGSMWLRKCKREGEQLLEDAHREFVQKIRTFDKVVIFTLQPISEEDIIPWHVEETIRSSPDNWFWLLREHPRQKPGEIPVLHRLQNLPKVDVTNSSTIPLFLLLNEVDFHLTCWSSVCVDALQFNVPSAFVHAEAQFHYEDLIEQGYFEIVLDADELGERIAQSDGTCNEFKYVNYDDNTVERAFKFIEEISPVVA